MDFSRYRIKREIVIHKLITCYYFEMAKNYSFAGESHDFWELLYVDKGKFIIQTERNLYNMRQGELLIVEPGMFHSTRSNGEVAPNVFVVSFECKSPGMRIFADHNYLHLGEKERELLTQLMDEGSNAFGPDLSVTPRKRLVRRKSAPFGSEQLFVLSLELLLVQLIRNLTVTQVQPRILTVSGERENQDPDLASRVIAFMQEHISEELTLDQLCGAFHIGKTQLSILFRNKTGSSVMKYWNRLKIEKAKAYIREDVFNLSEIAELLGYSSLHYFSKHFKKMTGTSPSEYAKILNKNMFKRI